ncbi:unnamed protein product [Camellia sinensis]
MASVTPNEMGSGKLVREKIIIDTDHYQYRWLTGKVFASYRVGPRVVLEGHKNENEGQASWDAIGSKRGGPDIGR